MLFVLLSCALAIVDFHSHHPMVALWLYPPFLSPSAAIAAADANSCCCNLIVCLLSHNIFKRFALLYSSRLEYTSRQTFVSFVNMSRAKNTVGAKEIMAVLRETHKLLSPKSYMSTDMDIVVSEHAEFLVKLLELTPRPTAKLLESAAKLAFDRITDIECASFGRQLYAAVMYCRDKAKSTTSGKKLQPATFKVVQMVKKLKPDRSPDKEASGVLPDVTSDPQGRRCHSPPRKRDIGESSSALFGSRCMSPIESSRDKIFRSFGLDPDKAHKPTACEEISSSQENVLVPETVPVPPPDVPAKYAPSSSSKSVDQRPVTYLDSAKFRMVRAMPDGNVIYATMQPGPGFFVEAVFEGEAPIETEISNLMFQKHLEATAVPKVALPLSKQPKAKAKAKAEAKGKAIVKPKGKAKGKAKAKAKGKAKAKAKQKKQSEDEEDEAASDMEEVDDGDGASPAEEDPLLRAAAAAAAAVASQGPSKAKAKAKARASLMEGIIFDGSKMNIVKVKEKSYICGIILNTATKTLIAGMTKNQHRDHQTVMQNVMNTLEKKGTFTEAFAVNLRNEMCA